MTGCQTLIPFFLKGRCGADCPAQPYNTKIQIIFLTAMEYL